MLDLLRKNSKHWGVVIIMSIATLSMVFFFGSYNTGRKVNRSWVAKIRGEEIPYFEFYRKYNNVVSYYRNKMGENFSEEMLEMYGLKQQLVNSMVDDVLLSQEAVNSHIPVIDEEVRDIIIGYPYFQDKGKFDVKLYKSVLPRMKMTAKKFEENIKRDLIKSRIEKLFLESAKISKEELRRIYTLKNSKIEYKYAVYNTSTVSVKPTVKEVKEYVKNNYDKIKVYYQNNNDEFIVPEKIKLNWIRITYNKEDPKSKEKAKNEADGLLLGLTKENFVKMAKKYSKAPKNGVLGYVSRNTYDADFETVAFDTAVGSISNVFDANGSFNIVYVEDKKDTYVRTIDSVKEEIASKFVKEDKKRDIIERKLAKVSNSRSLRSIERIIKSKFKKGKLSMEARSIDGISGSSSADLGWLFAQKKNKVTYKKILSNYYVFYITKKTGMSSNLAKLKNISKQYTREFGGNEFVVYKKNLRLKNSKDIKIVNLSPKSKRR